MGIHGTAPVFGEHTTPGTQNWSEQHDDTITDVTGNNGLSAVLIKKHFGMGGYNGTSRIDKTDFSKPEHLSMSTYWQTRRGTYNGKDTNISNVSNNFYFLYQQRATRTNLSVKNIYVTRTNSGRHSGDKSQSCVPYIIPSEMPGPKGYLMVENIYVKLMNKLNVVNSIR